MYIVVQTACQIGIQISFMLYQGTPSKTAIHISYTAASKYDVDKGPAVIVLPLWNRSLTDIDTKIIRPIHGLPKLMTDIGRIDLASHYNDVKMSALASQITSLMSVYSTVDSRADQRKRQSSASLVAGEFPARRASNAENVSIWWRHHVA